MTDIASDPTIDIILASAGLIALVIICHTILNGWREWLRLKRDELQMEHGAAQDAAPSPMVSRIEMADLKERLRKLEEIAAGVDP